MSTGQTISFLVSEPSAEELSRKSLADIFMQCSKVSCPSAPNVRPTSTFYAIPISNRFRCLKDYGASSVVSETQIRPVMDASLVCTGGGKVEKDGVNVAIAKKIAEYFKKYNISNFSKRHQNLFLESTDIWAKHSKKQRRVHLKRFTKLIEKLYYLKLHYSSSN